MEKKVQDAVEYVLASISGIAVMVYALLLMRDANGDMTAVGAGALMMGLLFCCIGIATVRSRKGKKK